MFSIIKSQKHRLYPNKVQIDALNKMFGSCRFVYNKLLEISIAEYEQWKLNQQLPKPNVSGYGFVNKIPLLKLENDWLKEVSAVALQQKALDLGKAFTGFFSKKSKFPKFKKKGQSESFRLVGEGFAIIKNKLRIANLNSLIKIKWERNLPSIPTSCTVTRNAAGQYFVSFVVNAEPKLSYGQGIVGIDLGIKDFAVLSNGIKIPNPKHFVSQAVKLARFQRQHSKKTKGSKNREKSRLRIAKLHLRIVNIRNDFLHKLSTQLIRDNQAIGLEGLKIVNMMKNHKLAKHIQDVAWRRFIELLTYKAKESGWTKLVFMDTFFPSTHLCSSCGEKLSEKLKLSDRQWVCPKCNTKHDRDDNASKVIEIMTRITLEMFPDVKETLIIADSNNFRV